MDLITFVHIPKTAGTSFRMGAEKYFGQQFVCRDYGPKAPETFESVRKWIYAEKDYYKFAEIVHQEKYRCIAGHIPANKYAPLFGVEHMIIFLRDPIQRILSEYGHFVRLHGYTGDLKTFYNTPQFINRQLKAFQGILWPSVGFIGTTEKYEESLGLINKKYGLSIPILTTNIGKETIKDSYALPDEDLENIRQLNKNDFNFYAQVSQVLEQRIEMAEAGKPFVRGMISGINGKAVTGWAFHDNTHACVIVEVLKNNQVIGEAVAREYRPNLNQMGGRRRGYVGFSLNIVDLKIGDSIVCRVKETGQPLVGSPVVASNVERKK